MSKDAKVVNFPKPIKSIEELREVAGKIGISIPLQAPFTPNDVNKAYFLLRFPLDEDAIQQSKASETRKGYDTTGYSYAAHLDRMNAVFGPSNWRWNIVNEQYDLGSTRNGYEKHSYTAEIVLEIGYSELNPETKVFEWVTVHRVPPIPTDHESMERGSARKGMLTKGIKRATSFLGVGADAYLGTLDDDLVTGADPDDDMRTKRKHDDQPIEPKDYNMLIGLAKKKGFTSELKLREFYKTKSEGVIFNDPASLLKSEVKQVKSWLFDLPDYKEPKAEAHQDPERAAEHGEMVPEETADMPSTLADLMAADEATIRTIAERYSFQMPAQLTDKNKGPLCKTLGHLMGLK